MLRMLSIFVGLLLLAVPSGAGSGTAHAQLVQQETVASASAVLQSALESPLGRIPQAMLDDAQGVAIIPNVIKGSFVVGARRGRGLLFVREPNGAWHAPVFITLTGGNIGWQVGVQSSDIILVFKTQRSVEGILSGKLTLGADAAAAAGPVGRQGGLATDANLQAEIYTYSRSRGLFAGVAIDGSVLRMDPLATGAYYGNPVAGGPVVVPLAAQQLTQRIAASAGASRGPTSAPAPEPDQPIAGRYLATNADVLRNQVTQLAPELFEMLDDRWRNYLALPSQLFLEGPHPAPAELQATLAHYDVVATDPRFSQLAARPEFQSVFGMLKHYQQSLTASEPVLQLPPPPQAEGVINRL